jgi:hypothetical protein
MTTAASASVAVPALSRRTTDFLGVAAAWGLAVLAAAVFPVENAQVSRVALFVHLMSMAVGFGSVILLDVYGLLWLFGYRTLSEVTALSRAAHGVISIGVGGLLASGIALRPDISSPLARVKLLCVLILMLNGVTAHRTLHRLEQNLPVDARGASIPWAAFQRVLGVALISQSTWWGAITIGFLTNANRNG